MATQFQQRRGTSAEWTAANPILADGEIGVEKDTGVVKIGNGTSTWNQLFSINHVLYAPSVVGNLAVDGSVTSRNHVLGAHWGTLDSPGTFEIVEDPLVQAGDTAYITSWGCLAVATKINTDLTQTKLYWRQVSTTEVSTSTGGLAGFITRLAASRNNSVHNGFRIYDVNLDRQYVSRGGNAFDLVGGKPGSVLTTGVTIGTGWSLTSASYSSIGNGLARVYVEASKTGTALTVTATGDIANFVLATMPAGWEAAAGATSPLMATATGRSVSGWINATGANLNVASVAPGGNIGIGESISLSGMYPLLDPTAV